jgi:hypothetical protein
MHGIGSGGRAKSRAQLRIGSKIARLYSSLGSSTANTNYPGDQPKLGSAPGGRMARKHRRTSATSNRHKKRAQLSPLEDSCWVFAFCFYVNEGSSDEDADWQTWRDLQAEFPRLKKYDGCK